MKAIWDASIADWVSQRMPEGPTDFDPSKGWRIVNEMNETVAGVVLHDFYAEFSRVELSAAADDPKWFTRGVRQTIFEHIFDNCRMVVAKTTGANRRARRLWVAMGATEYVIADFNGKGEDAILHTLTEDQWRKSALFKESRP